MARHWFIVSVLLAAGCGSPSSPAAAPVGDDVGVAEDDAGADGASADADAEPQVPGATEVLFDDYAPVWHFDIELSDENLDFLNSDITREEYVPGTVVFGSERFEDVGVRYKGGYGSLFSCVGPDGENQCAKLPLKLSFNKYVDGGRFRGVRKVLLHSCSRDTTCLRERLAYRLFLDAGIAAPRVVHATASINGEQRALYAMVEYIDDEFLEDHFEDEGGNLYKEAWPHTDRREYYLEALRTNEDVGDVSRMVSFAAVLSRTTDDSFSTDVEPWIDVLRMARYNAIDQLTHNWDGIWKFYCANGSCNNHNFYIYDDPTSGRFVVIPWDLDHTWSYPNEDMARSWWDDGPDACEIEIEPGFTDFELGIRAPQCDPLLRGLMRSGWDAYRAALAELLTGPVTDVDSLLQRLNRYRAGLRDIVATDPRGPSLAEWDAAVAQLRQVILAQYREADRLAAEP